MSPCLLTSMLSTLAEKHLVMVPVMKIRKALGHKLRNGPTTQERQSTTRKTVTGVSGEDWLLY